MACLYNRDFAYGPLARNYFGRELLRGGWELPLKWGVPPPLKMKPCYHSQHVCKGDLPNQTHYYEKCLNRTGWCCQQNGQTRRNIFEVLAECRRVLNWILGTCANPEFLSQSETLPRLITVNTGKGNID